MTIVPAILQVLSQLRGKLHGLLVVTSSVVPVDLAAALLRSGARCVICKDAAAAVPTATAAADFFSSFYSHLFAGTTILSAMASAGQQLPLPSLVCKGEPYRDCLCFHHPLPQHEASICVAHAFKVWCKSWLEESLACTGSTGAAYIGARHEIS